MGKSQQTFSKNEREKKKLKKREDKKKRAVERKANSKGGGLENMLAYVDEFGNTTDVPPDQQVRTEIELESIEIGVPKKEEVEDDGIYTGRIEYFDSSKGFGFIKDLDSVEKYFVHINGMIDQAGEGDKVTFELEPGKKGLNAVRVKKVAPESK